MTPATFEVLAALARHQPRDGDHWETAETLRGECRGRSASSIARSLVSAHTWHWVDRRDVGRMPYWRINDAGREAAGEGEQ